MKRRRRRPEVVVITGASAGIGRALALRLARRGLRLGLLARGERRLLETQREVEAAGGTALIVRADVADDAQVEAAATAVEAELGPIDVWVNNAMVSVFSPVNELTAAEIERVMRVSYLGYVHGTLAALRRMQTRGRGLIVQVSSALAFRSIPLQSAYCAAKHAVVGFTESLRTELLHDESPVRVTMVHLPAVNTPQFEWVRSRLPRRPQPVPPIYQPEVAARAIEWAMRHEPRGLAVGWPVLAAIAGNKVIPGLLDRYLARRGYDAQQTDELAVPRSDNLWQPAPGEFGAHGRFDSRSRRVSTELWMRMHRRALAGAVVLGVAMLRWVRRRRGISPG